MNFIKKIFSKSNNEELEELSNQINAAEAERNSIMKNFPYRLSICWHEMQFAADTIILKYGLQEKTDYTIFRDYLSSYNREEIFFKDKNIHDEIIMLIRKKDFINSSIGRYIDDIDKLYDSEIFINEYKLEACINFIPREIELSLLVNKIIGFYMKNDYKMPNANIFKTKMLVADRNKKIFTVYLRNKEEAAQLMLELGNFIEVIE